MLVAAILKGVLFNRLPSNKLRQKRQLLKEHRYWETFSHWFSLVQVSLDLACCYGSKQVFVWNRFSLLEITFASHLLMAMIPAACIEWCALYFCWSHWFPAYRTNLVLLFAPLKNFNETFINYACFEGHFIPNHLDLTLYEIQTAKAVPVHIIPTKRLQKLSWRREISSLF